MGIITVTAVPKDLSLVHIPIPKVDIRPFSAGNFYSFNEAFSIVTSRRHIGAEFWGKVTFPDQKMFIILASKELKKHPYDMTGVDYDKRFAVFRERSLTSLLRFWQYKFPQESRPQAIKRMCAELGIDPSVKQAPVFFEDFNAANRAFIGNHFGDVPFWPRVSPGHQRMFIETLANALHKPAGALSGNNFKAPIKELNGKSLRSFFEYWCARNPGSDSVPCERLLKDFGIDPIKKEKKFFVFRYDDPDAAVKIAPGVFRKVNGQLVRSDEKVFLTAEQERALARERNKGNIAARNALFIANQKLIYAIINRRFPNFRKLHFDEMVSTGRLGLLEVAKRFDPKRRRKFSTYAWRFVCGRIYHELGSLMMPHVSLDAERGEKDNTNLHSTVPAPGTDQHQIELEDSDLTSKSIQLTRTILFESGILNSERIWEIYQDSLKGTLDSTGRIHGYTRQGVQQIRAKVERLRNADPRWVAFMEEVKGRAH